jgi:hypothetical protein
MKLESVLRWLPAILVAAGIFFLSSLPAINLNPIPLLVPREGGSGRSETAPLRQDRFAFDKVDFVIKKGGHLVAFGLLAYTLEYGFNQDTRRMKIIICVLVLAYGISDEIHQAFVPGRSPGVVDVLIDVGATILVVNRRAAFRIVYSFARRGE